MFTSEYDSCFDDDNCTTVVRPVASVWLVPIKDNERCTEWINLYDFLSIFDDGEIVTITKTNGELRIYTAIARLTIVNELETIRNRLINR